VYTNNSPMFHRINPNIRVNRRMIAGMRVTFVLRVSEAVCAMRAVCMCTCGGGGGGFGFWVLSWGGSIVIEGKNK